jgi:hypothetical protein
MYIPIRVSSKPKVIGVKNGISQIEFDRNSFLKLKGKFYEFYNLFNSYTIFENQNLAFNFNNSDVLTGKKLKNATITDIMGFSPKIMSIPFIISEKFYNVIKDFNIGNHILFEVDIIDERDKYFLFFKKYITDKELYFPKSKFFSGDNFSGDYKSFVFSNYIDYKNYLEINPLIQIESIALKNTIIKEDLIFFQSSFEVFFSNELLNKLNDNNITGMEVFNGIDLIFVD